MSLLGSVLSGTIVASATCCMIYSNLAMHFRSESIRRPHVVGLPQRQNLEVQAQEGYEATGKTRRTESSTQLLTETNLNQKVFVKAKESPTIARRDTF